jgi:hypothetical protein
MNFKDRANITAVLYEYYLSPPSGKKAWMMMGRAVWCGCSKIKKFFISADGNAWHLHESNERPKQFVIPFDLFMRDEFNIEG